MDITVKATALALILCGVWYVATLAKAGFGKLWPRISAWWAGESAIIKTDVAALKTDMAVIKAKLGI